MTITAPSRALDPRPVRVAIIQTLLANGAVAAIVGTRIYPDDDVEGGVYPQLTVSVPSAVPDYDYSGSRINALFDVVAVDKSAGTRTVEALGYAAQAALVDSVWAISGYAMVGRQVEQIRPYSEVDNGEVFRYLAVTVRVIAEKQ
jgi:hypothetical protein